MAMGEIVNFVFKGDPSDLISGIKKITGKLGDVGDAADKAEREVNQSFSRLGASMEKTGQKLTTTGKALTAGVTVPLAYALKGMVDAAVEDQAAAAKLAGQLERTTGASKKQIGQVEDYIDKTMMATAVSDDKLRPAFERLARATGSTEEAQKDLNIAIDVSRATGKDLDVVAQAMARAHDGNTTALGKMGIATKDAQGKALDLQTVFENMNRQFGGASNDFMGTAAGKAELAKIKFGELQEDIGAALVPVMEDLHDVMSGLIDVFRAVPDWAQKAVVGLFLFKGPAMWLGGEGIKLIGSHITKLKTIREATAAAADAAARHGAEGGTAFAAGMNRGAHDAKSSMGGFKTFLSGLGITGVIAAITYSIDRSIDGWSKFKKAWDNADGPVLQRAQSSLDNWNSTQTRVFDNIGRYLIPGMDTLVDAQRKAWDPENAKRFTELMDQASQKGGEYATKAQEIANKNISAKDAVGLLNDVLSQTPAQIDPAVAKAEELATQMGMSADQVERLKQGLSDLSAFISFEQATLNTKSAVEGLADAIFKAKTEESPGGLKITSSELDGIYGTALNAASALENELKVGLETGKISAEEAATKIGNFDQSMQFAKEQAPQLAGKIDELRNNINSLKDKTVQVWVETAEAKRAIDNFKSYMTRTISTGNLNFWTLARGVNIMGGANERGGVIPFAQGGVYMANSGGGITRGPMGVIGEGREPREYVIPTDAKYRDRALGLMNQAAAELGVGAPRMSSSFTANINVSGGSDPQATAVAVADAVEQAFARKRRREGSLAFT